MSLLRIDFSAIEALMKTFDIELYNIPMQKQREMIDIASESVLKEVKKNARKMIHGKDALPETDGKTVANAAFIDTKHRNDVPPYVEINFKDTVSKYNEPRDVHPIKKDGKWYFSKKKGVIKNGKRRIAEVAFVNEYGVPKNKNQGARGYLSKAMDEGMTKAFQDMVNVIGDYIEDALVKSV